MKIKSITEDGVMTSAQAGSVFEKVEKAALYSFNKSHSVEYTMISYWGMYLKTHHPLEYLAATLTIAKDQHKVRALIQDGKDNGLLVMPPDINQSTDTFAVGEYKGHKVVFAALNAVKGVSQKTARRIMEVRESLGGEFGEYNAIRDNLTGRELNKTQLANLEKVGALHRLDSESLSEPPLHESRLKDQLELMPGIMTSNVRVDRQMDTKTIKPLIEIMHRDQISTCKDCALCDDDHPKPAYGKNPAIMVITDDPNGIEVKHGALMSHGAKGEIKAALSNAGLTTNDCYFTTLVKAKKSGKTMSTKSVGACRKFLDTEISLLKPPIIVALGSTTVRQLLPHLKGGIMELSGQAHYVKDLDATIVCGISPGMIYHDPSKQNDLDEVFMLASEMMPV